MTGRIQIYTSTTRIELVYIRYEPKKNDKNFLGFFVNFFDKKSHANA